MHSTSEALYDEVFVFLRNGLDLVQDVRLILKHTNKVLERDLLRIFLLN